MWVSAAALYRSLGGKPAVKAMLEASVVKAQRIRSRGNANSHAKDKCTIHREKMPDVLRQVSRLEVELGASS